MRGIIRTTSILLATLGLGCATAGMNVAFDERADLSKFETWAWLPRDTAEIDRAGRSAKLDHELARLLERRLLESGFRFSSLEPDFYVAFELTRRQRLVVVSEPSAIYELSSLHSSPSYRFEGSRQTMLHYSET
jgi:hypothetical protein